VRRANDAALRVRKTAAIDSICARSQEASMAA